MRRRLLTTAGIVIAGVAMVTLASLPAGAAPAPTAGWVLGYGFESLPAGSAIDRSPSGVNGVLRGVVLPTTAAGKAGHGRALSLDSRQRQFLDVPDAATLDVDRYTLAAWVRLVPRIHDDRWEVLEKAGAYWMNIRTDSRKVRSGGFFGSCDGQSGNTWRYLDSVRPIKARTWVHIATTYDGARLRIYVNGVLDASMPVTGRTCSNAEPLAVGAKNKTSAGLIEAYFDGRIDDLRVYDRALTAAQIKAVRAASVG